VRAIIIDEKDACNLLDQLKLATFEDYAQRECEIYGVSKEARKAIINEIHRAFHYRVTRWLQEQGASCVR
jgi:hypothetical protein